MKTLIIDTSYLVYRSYFAYPQFTSNGLNTGAIYGFIKTVMFLVKQFDPQTIVFACDLPEKTWRHEILDTYKAGRPEIEKQMREQFPYILEWCNQVTPNVLSKSGFEADDVIFTVCSSAGLGKIDGFNSTNPLNDFLIFSADKDLYQTFVYPNVHFIIQDKAITKLFSRANFEEKYQLQPFQWVDYKALVGDPSDNLKGVSGIGPKTAITILHEITSLGLLFEILNLPTIIAPKIDFTSEQKQRARLFVDNPKNVKIIKKIRSDHPTVEQTYFLATLQTVPDIHIVPNAVDFQKGLPIIERFNLVSLARSLKIHSIPELIKADENTLF